MSQRSSLRVSGDGRRLEHPDGTPFFYLADTAWELLHRLNREDTEHYLTTRASQGFTAVQTVILGERDGLRTPTPDGHVPFHDLDPSRPNEAYFAHVDWKRALHLPGANQMRHLRALVESRPFEELEPASGIVQALDSNVYADSNLQKRVRWTPWPAEGAEITRPTAAAGRDYALVYLPAGSPAKYDFSRLGNQVELWWYDPHHGTCASGGTTPAQTDWIDPPASNEDWVLVAQRPRAFPRPPGVG